MTHTPNGSKKHLQKFQSKQAQAMTYDWYIKPMDDDAFQSKQAQAMTRPSTFAAPS